MSKAIKFKNDLYLDSSSIVHNKESLNTKIIKASGKNNNGSWVQYEDGRMECFFIQVVTVDVTSSWGSMYQGTIELHDYPKTFIEPPVPEVTLLTNSSKWGGWLETRGASTDIEPTNSNPGSFGIMRPTSATGAKYKVAVKASGWWK